MTSTAAYALLAVVTVGPAVMVAPFLIARRSAEQHADRTAAAILAAARAAADRPKETAR